MRDLTVSLLQFAPTPEREANHRIAAEQVAHAARGGASVVVLPEMFTCPYALESFPLFAECAEDGPTAELLSSLAREYGLLIAGGSIPERDGDALYNTATLWAPDGTLIGKHRKVHLFDVDIPDGITFEESKVLSPGDQARVFETEFGRIGLAICFDLRFPELFRALALGGAELVLLPGAFNTTTGPAHWEPLLRARAIESTIYVAACSPAPHPAGGYPAWGHSMVVDPYGEVLARCEREETRVTATLSAARLAEVRRALPVLDQARATRFSASPSSPPARSSDD